MYSITITLKALVPVSFRMCIAFLAQPSALQEEGLFRVSGNKTLINQYSAPFRQKIMKRACV
jgi:hypothetical protein